MKLTQPSYSQMKNDTMKRHIVNWERFPARRCVVSQTPSSENISFRKSFFHIHIGPPSSSRCSEDLEKLKSAFPNVVSDSPANPNIEFLWMAQALRMSLFILWLHAFFTFASICIVPGINICRRIPNRSQNLLGINTWTKILSSATIRRKPPISARRYKSCCVTIDENERWLEVIPQMTQRLIYVIQEQKRLTRSFFRRWYYETIRISFDL